MGDIVDLEEYRKRRGNQTAEMPAPQNSRPEARKTKKIKEKPPAPGDSRRPAAEDPPAD